MLWLLFLVAAVRASELVLGNIDRIVVAGTQEYTSTDLVIEGPLLKYVQPSPVRMVHQACRATGRRPSRRAWLCWT